MLICLVSLAGLGLLTGGVARWARSVPDSMGWIRSLLLGVTGSLLGGVLAYVLDFGVPPRPGAGWILAIVGAVVLLLAGRFPGYARKYL
ncbi:Uncharacterized membrane protein YeaQ/YmgE, transglycosylase-associated protein family [Singulisphaera sp. GP187]|uniref:GlsB/YeaQ/YmgE family stress response membrane protein n=1 Tax=Singulisphaera sp. GP187 TaxID=1882752 RepID=UPI000926102E|nr:GlsB/YeaQ/YmgE family stress response membrane protein [Singulisphaera sp. GP187]SIO57377.1 Uncharacterized membrane protein YeaQ/YmgE, transglycosylase-associated protein family [Singulisphaera sp. GP187]